MLYSFVSSLLISILTESQLVVRWKEIDSYVNLPIHILNTNLTNDEGLDREYFNKIFYHVKPAQSWTKTKNINSLMKSNVPNALRYFYGSQGPLFMELCANPAYFHKFAYYNLVKNETLSKALKTISNNHSTQLEKQERLLSIGYELGGNILNRVWRPAKIISDDVEKYYEKYFKNNFVIGFQLRYQYLDKEDTKTFINCALDIEKNFLANKETYNLHRINTFKWFIASDTQNEINEIFKNFGNKTFTTNEFKLGHILYDPTSIRRAMLDVELLSLCNELIVTGASTFGWVAGMKSQKLPFYVNGQKKMYKCLRSRLSDPPTGGKRQLASF
jgi:hypothetical protein